MPIQLRCPICSETLVNNASGVCCANNHQFDRARQGYLNLLPSNKKKSKQPGDDAEMVKARARFLDQGYYQPVVNALVERIKGFNEQPLRILDAGCGEGYYTAELQRAMPDSEVCGVDISKPAVVSACRRNKAVSWLVASVSNLPLMDNQFDVIVSVFSRTDWSEFSRLLKPGGQILMVTPGQYHLLALRQQIYQDVRPYPEDKRLHDLPDGLTLIKNHVISEQMGLSDNGAIIDLLTMTPHYWHVKPEQKAKLERLQKLACELDMRVSVLQKENG